MNEKDLQLFQRCLRRNFSDKEIESNNLLSRPIDSAFRRQLAEIDWEFFCKYYLHRHFTKPFAQMHWELAEDFSDALASEEQHHEVIAFPREFGKTTWVSLGLPLYCVLFAKRKFIILLAQAYDQSKDYLQDIKLELEDNERILEDFGDLRGTPWQATEIRLANGVRVKPLGARMKLRGRKERWQRPDCIIADDLEDTIAVRNENERKARKTWIQRTVLRAGTDNTVFFFVGNKIHVDGCIAMLLENPLFIKRVYKAVEQFADREDLWSEWRRILTAYPGNTDRGRVEALRFYKQHRVEMDEGAVSSWPEGWSYYKLMLSLVTGGRSAFFAEMQNEPRGGEGAVFEYGTYRMAADDKGEVVLIPLTGHPAVKLSQCKFFGSADPSLGKKRSDPSALIFLALAPTGQMFLLVDDERSRPPYTIIRDIQRHHLKFPTVRFAIEVVQFQALFATDAAKEAMRTGTYINYVQVPAKTNKYLRIQSLEPAISMHYVLIPEHGADTLKSQLQNWPNCANDDGLDALELAYRIASTYSEEPAPQIIEGDSIVAGNHTLFAPVQDPFFLEAEKRAHERDVLVALEEGREPPKEQWWPKMRY